MLFEGGCEEGSIPKSLKGHFTVNTAFWYQRVDVSICVDLGIPVGTGPHLLVLSQTAETTFRNSCRLTDFTRKHTSSKT